MRLFGKFGNSPTDKGVSEAFEEEEERVALPVPVAIGDLVRDVVSGFTGVVTVWQYHLHGCDRLEVDPTDLSDNGSVKDAFVFDIMRLEVLEQGSLEVRPYSSDYDNYSVGAEVQDNITGLKGIIDMRAVSYTGDIFIHVTPRTLDKDGAPAKGMRGMAGRFKYLGAGLIPVAEQAPVRGRTGGPSERRSPARAER